MADGTVGMSDEKPKDACIECNKNKGADDWLQCDYCDGWTHRQCANINATLFKALKTKKTTENIMYICSPCKVERTDEAGRKDKIDGRIDRLLSIMEGMRKDIQRVDDSVEERIDRRMREMEGRLEHKIQEQGQRTSGRETERKEQVWGVGRREFEERVERRLQREDSEEERGERAKRAKNILIFGIPEPKEKENDHKQDVGRVQEVLKELQGREGDANQIEEVVRLGRRGERIRPIKVGLKSSEQRNAVLKNSKLLKDHEKKYLQKVYVSADQTIRQREMGRELREELRRRRENGEDVVIHRNRVIVRDRRPGLTDERESREEGEEEERVTPEEGRSDWNED